MLLGAVMGTECLQLGLSFAQLSEDLILWVLCRAILRLQQALRDQLLLDAALQGLGMWHTAGKGSPQFKGQFGRGTPWRYPRLVNTFLLLGHPLYIYVDIKNIETSKYGPISNTSNIYPSPKKIGKLIMSKTQRETLLFCYINIILLCY